MNKDSETSIDKHETKIMSFGRPNLVIGLTGPFGSGCSTMRQILASDEFGFKGFTISTHIRKELKDSGEIIDKGDPGWRRILQDHGDKKREEDSAYWIKKVVNEIDNNGINDKDEIVIDGFRNILEVQEIRKIYPNFFLVAVCAEREKRWSRVQNDYKGNQSEFEDDDRRDQNEDLKWGQSVQKCVDDADYVYYNNEENTVTVGSSSKPNTNQIDRIFKKQAKDFVPLMRGEMPCRDPKSEELEITVAYAQSHASRCIKRHVGAVITINKDSRELPISMGFNENPSGINTCKSENACYKDENMSGKLEAKTQEICCPSCGKKYNNLKKPWICEGCGANFKNWLFPNRNMVLCTAIHAEERAILSLCGRSAEGGTIYVTTFPCFQCARLILDSGIKKIIYVEAYPVLETATFLRKNGVDVIPFTGFTSKGFFRVFPKVN